MKHSEDTPSFIVTHKSFYDFEAYELIPTLYQIPEDMSPNDALQALWTNHYESEMNEAIASGGVPIDESESYCVDGYGKIAWMDGDYVEYHITQPSLVKAETFQIKQKHSFTR